MQITKRKEPWRVEARAAKVIDPIDQKNQLHPEEPSVSVARRDKRQEWAASERQFRGRQARVG
jgi:hypothetical protein